MIDITRIFRRNEIMLRCLLLGGGFKHFVFSSLLGED